MDTEKRKRDSEGSIIKKEIKKQVAGGKVKKETVFFARLRYTDKYGRNREKKRKADSYADAITKRRELRSEIEREARGESVETVYKTFTDLATHFEKEYAKPPVYRHGNKVSGMQSHIIVKGHVKLLKDYFKDSPLELITYSDIRKFREKRINVPVVKIKKKKVAIEGSRKKKVVVEKVIKPRGIVSVNRPLETLRRMLNIAVQLNWIKESPFKRGDALIKKSQERQRRRILTFDEEKKLLAECTGLRSHLLTPLICRIDTALRHSELSRLVWSDVDFQNMKIHVRKEISKINLERVVPISPRLYDRLMQISPKRPNKRVFDVSSYKRSFGTACRLAGITDFTWRDLRHTAITWMIASGVEIEEAMRISGHLEHRTFLIYVNLSEDILKSAREKMQAFQEMRYALTA